MSARGITPAFDAVDEVAHRVSTKLAGFLRTLRDNGFAVGLAEGQDATALMAAGYAQQASLLRSAFKHLFSARKSDWDKFDGLFDAFWLRRRVRMRSSISGAGSAASNPSLKSLQDARSERDPRRSRPLRQHGALLRPEPALRADQHRERQHHQ